MRHNERRQIVKNYFLCFSLFLLIHCFSTENGNANGYEFPDKWMQEVKFLPLRAERNVMSTCGWTSLTLAVVYGDGNRLQKLVEQDLDLNAKDAFGRSLVLLAAEHGHFQIMDKLIGLGANPHIPDNRGRTPSDAVSEYKKINGTVEDNPRVSNANIFSSRDHTCSISSISCFPCPFLNINSLEAAMNIEQPEMVQEEHIVIESPDFSTSLTQTSNKVDLDRYRISGVREKYKSGKYWSWYTSGPYYLEIAGCSRPIQLESKVEPAEYFRNAEKPEWLIEDKSFILTWDVQAGGTGMIRHKRILVVEFESRQPRILLNRSLLLFARSGGSSRMQTTLAYAFDKKLAEITFIALQKNFDEHRYKTHNKLSSGPNSVISYESPLSRNPKIYDEIDPVIFSSTLCNWKYKHEGSSLRKMEGEQHALWCIDLPLINIALHYNISLPELYRINPDLKGQVFCRGESVLIRKNAPAFSFEYSDE